MLTALRRARHRLPLAARVDASELLDTPGLTPGEVERNLADLARLNRLPGGVDASVAGIRHLLDGRTVVRLLDVGTGRADMPIRFAREGWPTTAIDSHPEVLRVARRATAAEPAVTVTGGDARALPFEDGAFDVGHCSLFVHHLDPDDAVGALRELRRVARVGVVINDLRRGVVPLLATAVGIVALGRSRVTHHDGIASARRAYTLAELDEMLDAAGLAVRRRSAAWMPRVVTVATPKG